MAGVAAAAIGASTLASVIGSQNAANTQAGAANNATALQAQNFAQQQKNEAPYQAAGVAALSGLQDPRFQHDFSAADFTASPGYQFSLKQGQDAINAANSASGNQVSGAGLAALSNYNIGSANQEYQQAFENYQQQQNNQFGRLSQIAGMGAGANSAMGAAGTNFANAAGNNMMGAANAAGAAGIAGASAIGKGITGIAGNLGAPKPGGLDTSNNYTTPSQNGMTLAGGPMDSGAPAMSASNLALG